MPTQTGAVATLPASESGRLAADEMIQGSTLLVDSQHGRLYALAVAGFDGAQRIAVFAARDGRLVAIYENGGPLALDATGGRLFVDRGAAGLVVLEAATGKTLQSFVVPDPGELAENLVAPQFDPATGQVLVFRGHTVYALDGDTGQVARAVEFDLRPQDNCRSPHDMQLPIVRTFYDQANRFLYLDFTTYVCTPYIGYTNVSYDWANGAEIARQGSTPYQGLAAGRRFYAQNWYRFGIGALWTERDGHPEPVSTGWSDGGTFQLDARRGRLYQRAVGGLRVFDADDLRLLAVVPQTLDGALAGFDEATDQLYFVAGQVVRGWPARQTETPATAPMLAATPPGDPVRVIVPSPGWSQDKTLLGVWAPPWPETGCYVYNQTGGPLLLSEDGGQGWQRPQAGLPGVCGISALALSPDYANDRTVLAGVKGYGIFVSHDGGKSWQPAGAGLPHVAVHAVAFSPGYAVDRIAFAIVQESGLQRSVDGAASWQTLDTARPATLLALSPEFDRDGTAALYAAGEPALLQFSQDGGEHWRTLEARLPGNGDLRLISLAPAYARWQVMFALDSAGDLYRSADGGQGWQRVLVTGSVNAERSQIVYGSNEEQRPVFLLVSGVRYEGESQVAWGKLFRSTDGGQHWSAIQAGAGIPTALAISPSFDQDGLIFVGTADGRVLSLRGIELVAPQP